MERLEAGGRLSKVQRAMDILDMHLSLKVNPERKTIEGFARLSLELAPNHPAIELDLVDSLRVSRCEINGKDAVFRHAKHKLFIQWPEPREANPSVTVHYAGNPWEATDPPWEGGFNWDRTDGGSPWVGVSCQSYGAKVWFPSKNHPDDKIQGLSLSINVPKPLYCAANGLLKEIEPQDDGTRTFHWHSKYPIAGYNVSINVADFDVLERTYSGKKDMPVIFYALREYQKDDQLPGDTRSYAEKKNHILDESIRYLEFFAKHFGEFPFIDEKFGIAHTAYYGMEHQTINSYGNHFRVQDGYDFLLFHEMSHEWWGNKVTVKNWEHYWIHEGIGTYTSGMYLEEMSGRDAMLQFFKETRLGVSNNQPLVPKRDATTRESYNLDVYNKGALVVHALRYLLGKETLYKVLYEVANDPRFNYNENIDTDDFIRIAEKVANRDLGWFFQRYLYHAKPPALTVKEKDGKVFLAWDDSSFTMPLDVVLTHAGETVIQRLVMPNGRGNFEPGKAEYQIDPDHWVYKTVVQP